MSGRLELSGPAREMLEPIAQAIANREVGFILTGGALQATLQQSSPDAIVEYLDGLVRVYTHGQRAVRRASQDLLYHYYPGIELVTCWLVDAQGVEEISEYDLTLQAWVLMESGLLPAEFDRIPESAEFYLGDIHGL